jgi:hypothetical protein
MSLTAGTTQSVIDGLSELIDELLDAHCDTVCLGDELQSDPEWAAHLAYLRDLQRAGHAIVARAATANS